MLQNFKCRGFLSVIGAFMIAMGIGLMYLWGIIAIYATSYFRLTTNNLHLTEQTTNIVFPLLLFGQAISIPIAGRLYKRTNSRFVCMICGVVLAMFIYFASYTQRFSTFVWLFGIAPGIVVGFLYVYPTAHCCKFFPHKKTLIAGLIISASGIGTLFFAIMAHDTINHSNQSISQQFGYYGSQIALKFPSYLRNLSAFLLIFVTGGGLLLFQVPSGIESIKTNLNTPQNKIKLLNTQFDLHEDDEQEQQQNPFGKVDYEMAYINQGFQNSKKKIRVESDREFWKSINQRQSDFMTPKQEHEHIQQSTPQTDEKYITDNINECPRVRDGPKQPIFWILFACILLSANFGLLISCNYKTYTKYKMDDEFLTFVGAFGALLCGISRYIWTELMGKFSFRYLLWLLLVANSFLAFTIYYISSVPFIYLVYVLASWVVYGGLLGMFPIIASNIFGSRYSPQIYGFLFYAFPISNLIQFLLIQWIKFQYGYWFVFMISGGMSVCGLLLSNRITIGQYNWSHRIRQNNQRKRLLAR